MGADERAGSLLQLAWHAVYGPLPIPSDAYRQAVRAVEAVACPLIVPNDRQRTLGKAIGAVRAHRDRWAFVLRGDDSVDVVINMMALLWTNQHDRHVAFETGAPLHVSGAEAETAVHLAATLVHWLSTGKLQSA